GAAREGRGRGPDGTAPGRERADQPGVARIPGSRAHPLTLTWREAPQSGAMNKPASDSARAALLRDPNFRWLSVGGAISLLGDQFTLIALPWLVLKVS